VRQLKESIARSGLDTPLTIWNDPDVEEVEIEDGDKKYSVKPTFLVAGMHRRAALRLMQKEDKGKFNELFPGGQIPVVERKGTLKEALCAQVRENSARKNPSAEELLPLMQRLRDEFKMTGKQIALETGTSPSWVSNIFDIEELEEEGQEAVKKGELSAKHAMKAAKVVKAAKKSGKPVDVKAHVEQAKAKTKADRDAGRQREVKKLSWKKCWSIYTALPGMKIGLQIDILEGIFKYQLEDGKLPQELKLAATKKSKVEKD
jgi:ParB-like chromosome segregation protein Spo0J